MLDLYVEISQLLGQAVEVGKIKNLRSLLAVSRILCSVLIARAPKVLLILPHAPKAADRKSVV